MEFHIAVMSSLTLTMITWHFLSSLEEWLAKLFVMVISWIATSQNQCISVYLDNLYVLKTLRTKINKYTEISIGFCQMNCYRMDP
jgi:hypothetical protein